MSPYRLFDLAEFFELGTESAIVGVPCKATVTGQSQFTVAKLLGRSYPMKSFDMMVVAIVQLFRSNKRSQHFHILSHRVAHVGVEDEGQSEGITRKYIDAIHDGRRGVEVVMADQVHYQQRLRAADELLKMWSAVLELVFGWTVSERLTSRLEKALM